MTNTCPEFTIRFNITGCKKQSHLRLDIGRGDELAIFGFFAKKNNPECEVLQKKLQDAAEHSSKVLEHLNCLEKIAITIDNRQKEMVIQLDELDAVVNEDPQKQFEPLMALSDIIYDFFCYSKKDEAIIDQARMMWQGTTSALKKVGMEVVDPTGETFNYILHIAHSTTSEPDIPHECISETLKCGYVYGDKILRRATVIVNKRMEEVHNDGRH